MQRASDLLPKGTRIEMLAHFDNSVFNPYNPRKPPLDVRWGERTYDEMCIAFLNVTYDNEHRRGTVPGRFRKKQLTGSRIEPGTFAE